VYGKDYDSRPPEEEGRGRKITILTAYDYPFARSLTKPASMPFWLGDSLGVVVQGLENTLPVTIGRDIYHTKMVARAVKMPL